MVEAIRPEYQVSSEGAVRHWEIPYARLEDTTPTPTLPAAVLSGTDGDQLTGTILTVHAGDSIAVIDFTCSMVYLHEVRTADGYNGAAENSWAAIVVGTRVYYDRSGTMPAGVYLSLSPTDSGGNNNAPFGTVVPSPAVPATAFPLAAGAAGNTWDAGVMQYGAAGHP